MSQPLNLYLLEWEDGGSWDQFRSITVAASSLEDALTIHPWSGTDTKIEEEWKSGRGVFEDRWIEYQKRHQLKVWHFGTALPFVERGVITSDFHNG
jgi:hypothetical protein